MPQERSDVPSSGTGWSGSDVRQHNLGAVLAQIVRGPVARSDIARATGMSPATVTVLTAELLDLGLIDELPALSDQPGRPRVPLASSHDVAAVGVLIGARRSTVAICALDGTVLARRAVVNPVPATPEAVMSLVVETLEEHLRHVSQVRLLGTGIATTGRVDPATGILLERPRLGWTDVDLTAVAGGRLPAPVVVTPTVRSAAITELRLGLGQTTDTFAVMLATSAVSVTVVSDGRVRAGAKGAAGNIAHVKVTDAPWARCTCGRVGCLQACATDDVLLERATEAGIEHDGRLFQIMRLAAAGDERAQRLLADRSRYVARAAAMVLDFVDPPVLKVFGLLTEEPRALLVEECAAWVSAGTDVEERLQVPDAAETMHMLALSAAGPVIDRVLADPRAFMG